MHTISRGLLLKKFLSESPAGTLTDFLAQAETDAGDIPLDIGGFNLLLMQPAFSSHPSNEHLLSTSGVTSHTTAAEIQFDAAFVTNHGGGRPIKSRLLDTTDENNT